MPRAVCDGSSGMSWKASVDVCGSSRFGRAGEGPGSAGGSAAPAALGVSESVNAGCTGSCRGTSLAVVSSEDLDSLDSDDLDESSPSVRETCFCHKECHCYTVLQ